MNWFRSAITTRSRTRRLRQVISRMRSLKRATVFGWVTARVTPYIRVTLCPRNLTSHGRATLLFSAFTFSLSFRVM